MIYCIVSVIAYATLQSEPGGNYFNLVVFCDGKTADDFASAKTGEGKKYLKERDVITQQARTVLLISKFVIFNLVVCLMFGVTSAQQG